jgi:hypothetical protein
VRAKAGLSSWSVKFYHGEGFVCVCVCVWGGIIFLVFWQTTSRNILNLRENERIYGKLVASIGNDKYHDHKIIKIDNTQ